MYCSKVRSLWSQALSIDLDGTVAGASDEEEEGGVDDDEVVGENEVFKSMMNR